MRGDECEHGYDDQHADDVPPYADVVEQRDQPDSELVQQTVQEQHASVDDDGDPGLRRYIPLEGEERVDKERGSEVNARCHGAVAEDVKQPREQSPGGGVVLPDLGG